MQRGIFQVRYRPQVVVRRWALTSFSAAASSSVNVGLSCGTRVYCCRRIKRRRGIRLGLRPVMTLDQSSGNASSISSLSVTRSAEGGDGFDRFCVKKVSKSFG